MVQEALSVLLDILTMLLGGSLPFARAGPYLRWPLGRMAVWFAECSWFALAHLKMVLSPANHEVPWNRVGPTRVTTHGQLGAHQMAPLTSTQTAITMPCRLRFL